MYDTLTDYPPAAALAASMHKKSRQREHGSKVV
jgi:hypothetical protein